MIPNEQGYNSVHFLKIHDIFWGRLPLLSRVGGAVPIDPGLCSESPAEGCGGPH